MRINYNKLWKLLIDRHMSKTDLRHLCGISTGTLAKLGKGESVSTDTLVKICEALNVDVSEIMEIKKVDD